MADLASQAEAPLPNQEDTFANTTTPKKKTLFDLPPEIRNRIYSFVVEIDMPIALESNSLSPTNHPTVRSKQKLHPSLLRTSRQISLEATPLFYNLNAFQASRETLHAFFIIIGPTNIACLRSVEFTEIIYWPGELFPELHRARNLENFVICILKDREGLDGEKLSSGALDRYVGPLFRGMYREQKKSEEKKNRDVAQVLRIFEADR